MEPPQTVHLNALLSCSYLLAIGLRELRIFNHHLFNHCLNQDLGRSLGQFQTRLTWFQTVVIIVSYVLCSTPAVGLQLWVIWVEKSDNLSELFFLFPLLPAFFLPPDFLASHFCTDWLSCLGLGNLVGSTTDQLAKYDLPSTPKDRSVMWAELTGVSTNRPQ